MGFSIPPPPGDRIPKRPRRPAPGSVQPPRPPQTPPKVALRLGVGGSCSPDMEGGREGALTRMRTRRLDPGGRTGREAPSLDALGGEVRSAASTWSRRGPGRDGAVSPRSPRPPVGGALVMHYSSPSRPPAASLAFPAQAAGSAEERERVAFTILWQLRE